MIHKYRKKPSIIEAIKWTGENNAEINELLQDHTDDYKYTPINGLLLQTNSGYERFVEIGDYVTVDGAFRIEVYDAQVFKQLYELEIE